MTKLRRTRPMEFNHYPVIVFQKPDDTCYAKVWKYGDESGDWDLVHITELAKDPWEAGLLAWDWIKANPWYANP